MRFGSLSRAAGEKRFPAVSARQSKRSGPRPERSFAIPYLIWNQLIADISFIFRFQKKIMRP